MAGSLIVCFSRGGATARVAEAIAAGLRSAECDADLVNMNDGQPPDFQVLLPDSSNGHS